MQQLSRLPPVAYSTAAADGMVAFVAERYGIRDAACALLHRGLNDVYDVTTPEGRRFVLRVSGRRARGPADVSSETAFLAYLHASGVPVATAVPTREGALFTAVGLPDGTRAVVLFHHAGGRAPELDSADDARLQASALARLHRAAEGYPGRQDGLYRLELPHLLHDPVDRVLALGLDAPQARRDLVAVAERLAQGVAAVDRDLTRIRLHGDCHGLNAHIVAADAGAGATAAQAVLFDFDDGGFGYLAYDLAVHLWAQVSFGRKRHAIWRAFHAGYRSARPLAPADEAAIPLFVPIRHIWLMGEYAGRTAQWGTGVLSAAWLRREVDFLLGWEQAELSPRLL